MHVGRPIFTRDCRHWKGENWMWGRVRKYWDILERSSMVLVLYGARTCARSIQRSVHRCAITSLRSTSDHSREINRGHIRCLFSTEARKKEEKKEKKKAKLIHYRTVDKYRSGVWGDTRHLECSQCAYRGN